MKKVSRRKFIYGGLIGFGGLGLTAWFAKNQILRRVFQIEKDVPVVPTPAPLIGDDLCIMTSSTPEGPFYLDAPFRVDVREKTEGITLDLELQIIDYPNCIPVTEALAVIWSCDAHGQYPGYPKEIGHNPWEMAKLVDFGGTPHIEPTNNTTFLRGSQSPNENGIVKFKTTFPGWYDPRIPHIHFKIILSDNEEFACELYFEEDFARDIFTTKAPYNKYGENPYNFKNDLNMKNIENANGLILLPEWNADKTTLKAKAKIGLHKSQFTELV